MRTAPYTWLPRTPIPLVGFDRKYGETTEIDVPTLREHTTLRFTNPVPLKSSAVGRTLIQAVRFTFAADRREHFIAEALRNARGSLANEPGCLRFDVLVDPDDPLVFYFDEAYEDEAAMELHRDGENFQRFIKAVSEYADGPTPRFTGTTVEDPAA